MSPPKTHDQLHTWIKDTLNINLSRTVRICGHSSHFDYICHSYFVDSIKGGPTISGPLDAVVLAPRGGGKTFLGALATTLDLVHKPGIQIRILAGSQEQGSRMLAYLRQFFALPTLAPLVEGKGTRTSLVLSNGSRVQVLAQSHASVRGIRVHKIRCDEVELFADEIFSAVQLTTVSTTCGEFQVRGTIDCLSTQHLVGGIMQRLVRESESGTRSLFKWSLLDVLSACDDQYTCRAIPDVPDSKDCQLLGECNGAAKVVSPTIRGHMTIGDAIRMKSRVDVEAWRSEMLCQRPGRDQAVFTDFARSTHVVTRDPPTRSDCECSRTILGGMDFGFRSPTVILWAIREVSFDGTELITVVDEYVQTQRSIQDHIKVLAHRAGESEHPSKSTSSCTYFMKPLWIGADPAGAANTGASSRGSPVSQLRQAGFQVKTARFEIQAGLALLRAKLFPATGARKLVIHARCHKLIEALESYHYPTSLPNTEVPEKDGPDHLCDALRYMIVNLELGNVTARRYT